MTVKNTVNPDFKLESFLPYRLSVLSNTVSDGVAAGYRQTYGLSVTEWRIIAVLGRFPGLTASDIVLRTAMDKVAVSRAVKKLQARSLIEVLEHRKDRRRRLLNLTAGRGHKLFREVVPRALVYESKLLEVLSAQDRKSLDDLLERLQSAASALNEGKG